MIIFRENIYNNYDSLLFCVKIRHVHLIAYVPYITYVLSNAKFLILSDCDVLGVYLFDITTEI